MGLSKSCLGEKSSYINHYTPSLLFPIARENKRTELNIKSPLPFKGFDIWTAFELSWLNNKGKPIVALGEFVFPCTSTFLIESKSLKLYFNSFNNTKFNSLKEVKNLMQKDLSQAAGENVYIKISLLNSILPTITSFSGHCIDNYNINCENYIVNPEILSCTAEKKEITDSVYSNLLKSNCLVTGQPDWASIQISYTGRKINYKNLLKYIISFRNHNEFHEQCVERIFMDIMGYCAPKKLTVYARYTRRGGIDINPYRSTEVCVAPENIRLLRQ